MLRPISTHEQTFIEQGRCPKCGKRDMLDFVEAKVKHDVCRDCFIGWRIYSDGRIEMEEA